MITAEQIRRSGATNAWEVIRRNNFHHLQIRQSSVREHEVSISHRGVSSLLLSNQVMVVVDGTRMTDWSYLREVPARTILHIEILPGRAGTVRYGSTGGNGVIEVKTDVPTT